MSYIHAGLRFTDIERLLGQMYYDTFASDLSSSTLQVTFNNRNAETNQCQIQSPGRRVITNCFLRCYFEQEHMYSQRMSELPRVWLSADHTFKVSANNGAWCQGVWVEQFDSLFTVLNEKGQVLAWRLTRGTSFDKVGKTRCRTSRGDWTTTELARLQYILTTAVSEEIHFKTYLERMYA